MLCKAQTLKGYTLASLDGTIGTVKEFYFDDQHWVVRYLIADTGSWLSGRQVLISPYALMAILKDGKQIAVNLTKKQIEDSPAISNDKPVSRQFEDVYYEYYGWPNYYSGPYMWGTFPHIMHDRDKWQEQAPAQKTWDLHLRSTQAVSEYYIQATDGEIGHVDDFIIDDESWAIRYMVVGTRNWWPGKKVLVSPQWIDRISWDESKVFFSITREAIMQSPEYTEKSLLTRDYETKLHSHYNRLGYWLEKKAAMEA